MRTNDLIFSYTTNEQSAPIAIIKNVEGIPELLINYHYRLWIITNRKLIAQNFSNSFNRLLDEIIEKMILQLDTEELGKNKKI